MPNDEEVEELVLLLLALVAKDWLNFYSRTEREVLVRYRSLLQRIERIEGRAVERYRSELSEFRTRESPGGTRIVRSPRRSVEFETAMRSVYMPPVSRGGQIEARLLRDMRQLSTEAAAFAHAHAVTVQEILESMDLPSDEHAVQQVQGTVTASSAWAARRDIEIMHERAAHSAAISAFGASDSGLLREALSDAPRAVRIPRSSTRNSLQGSARQAVRSAVYRTSSPPPGWLAIRPYLGAPAVNLSPRTEADWIRLAKKRARGGGWRPGNPISGHGLHVGSRTYFAPVPVQLAAMATTALLFAPTYVRDLLRLAPTPSYDRRGTGVFRLRGRRIETLADFRLSIQDALDDLVREAAPLPVPVAQLREQPKIEGLVRAIFTGNSFQTYKTLSIDVGRNQGVEMDMVFRVTSPLPPPVVKGQATVIALYPDFATLLFEFGPRTEEPRLFDYVTTLGSA